MNRKEVTWEYNRLGIPMGFREWKVQSVELGTPDPTHFEIPAGYRIPASRIDSVDRSRRIFPRGRLH